MIKAKAEEKRTDVTVELDEGEPTEEMRAAYNRFWELFLGRILGKGVENAPES